MTSHLLLVAMLRSMAVLGVALACLPGKAKQ